MIEFGFLTPTPSERPSGCSLAQLPAGRPAPPTRGAAAAMPIRPLATIPSGSRPGTMSCGVLMTPPGGAYDLAVGNLFGSNAFNMTILLVADLAYTDGPVLGAVAPAQVVAGVGAILLMAIALAAVVHGTRTRIRRLEPDAIVLLATYVVLLGAVWRAEG